MSDTLFDLPDSPSPRLAWLARHGLTMRKTEAGKHECVLDDENVATGDTIDEACVAFCVETGMDDGGCVVTALRIYVELDDDDQFRLMCADGRMSPTVCGQRLFRAPPYPDIKFSHATIEAANADAAKLRAYLAALAPTKNSKKRTAESAA